MARHVRFHRAPCVVSYWEDATLIYTNYATGTSINAEPLTTEILHFFDRWRAVDELIARFSDYTAASLRTAVSILERHSFLVPSNRRVDPRVSAMARWGGWNPAAGFFHATTKDVRFARNQDEADQILDRKAESDPTPAPVKRYRGAQQIRLPPINSQGEFPSVLFERRTWREFARLPITTADISTLLGITWGVRYWLDVPPRGRLALKTSPSGGALHPIEVYVFARRIQGVRRGLYHYSPDRHRLELIRAGAGPRQIDNYLPAQPWFRPAPALLLMTAVFPRTQWKYDFPRAYRVVLAEAGHLCQTFCLTATWLGLAPFCTMALADSRIEKDLGIDGVTESVLYAAGVGARPDGVKRPTQ